MATPVADQGKLYLLALLVASSSTFQTLVGAADAAAALNSVYYPWADDDDTYPRAVVHYMQRSRVRVGPPVGQRFKATDNYLVAFEFEIPDAEAGSTKDQWSWFNKKTDDIWGEMEILAGTGSSGVNNLAHFNMVQHEELSMFRMPAEERAHTDPETGKPKPLWIQNSEVMHQ